MFDDETAITAAAIGFYHICARTRENGKMQTFAVFDWFFKILQRIAFYCMST